MLEYLSMFDIVPFWRTQNKYENQSDFAVFITDSFGLGQLFQSREFTV